MAGDRTVVVSDWFFHPATNGPSTSPYAQDDGKRIRSVARDVDAQGRTGVVIADGEAVRAYRSEVEIRQ